MPQEQHSPIASRLLLGNMLRQLREEADLSGVEVADQMGFGAAKLSKIEQGQTPVTKADLNLLCEVLDVTGDIRPTLIDLAAQSRKPRRSRTRTSEDALPGRKFEKYLGLEEVAASIKVWETHLIPGILQTSDYARALLEANNPRFQPAEIEQLVHLRTARQRVLKRTPDPLELWVVMEETALRRVVGNAEIHRAQLLHLLDMGQHPNLNIQVIPRTYGAHAGLDGSFAILDIGNQYPPVVYVESRGLNTYIEGVGELANYQSSYNQIQSAAAPPIESARIIETIVKESP